MFLSLCWELWILSCPRQGHSQPHHPGWAKVPLSHFRPHFGSPCGRIAHLEGLGYATVPWALEKVHLALIIAYCFFIGCGSRHGNYQITNGFMIFAEFIEISSDEVSWKYIKALRTCICSAVSPFCIEAYGNFASISCHLPRSLREQTKISMKSFKRN